jgi:hypothetical protein
MLSATMGALYYADDRLPAAEMGDATRALRKIEQGIEDLLVEIFPGWRPHVPRLRGWRYSLPDAVDVYDAVDSKAAADTLHRAGFLRVTAHAHDNLARCSYCESRFAHPGSRLAQTTEAPAVVVEVDERSDDRDHDR